SLRLHPRTHAQPGDRRTFEDPDAVLDQQAPEAARQPRRVDGRGIGDQYPASEPRGRAPLLDLAGGEDLILVLDAQRAGGVLHGAPPGPVVPLFRRAREVAAVTEPGVDAVRPAPGADLGRRATARH